MDIDILVTDVKIELNLILRLANCPVVPFNYTQYAERMIKILEDMQVKSEKISGFYNLYHLIDEAKELRGLSEKLEAAVKKVSKEGDLAKVAELNECLMWVGRYVNPVSHSDADIANQVSMETFGAQPFPRISEITDLASMTLHQSPEFKLLYTKLVRERNIVEDGFYQANELIRATLEKL
jgi:hypothetical protein